MSKLYSPEDSIRGACHANLISKSALRALAGQAPNNVWFVDAENGNDNDSGKVWQKAFATINKLDDVLEEWDWVYLIGDTTGFNEAYTCSLDGVRFIGAGNIPGQCIWTAPTVAGSWCLKLTGAFCRVENIRFRPVAYTTSGIPSAIQLAATADYTSIVGCRFQGRADSYKAIYMPAAAVDNVKAIGNEFIYLNTATYGAAIFGAETGGQTFGGWEIVDNRFNSCVTAIDMAMRACLVKGNTFDYVGVAATGDLGNVLSLGLDPSGTSSGGNTITGNYFGGDYALALYKPSTGGDNWMGNFAAIKATTCPNGVTVLPPAA